MNTLYINKPIKFVYQDVDHTGKIHEADENKHYGMFIFDLGGLGDKYIAFRLNLSVLSYNTNIEDEIPIFNIIPGGFSNPVAFPLVNFLEDDSLSNCGWTPIEIPDGSLGETKILKYTVNSTIGSKIDHEFIFKFDERFLGFLIEPCVVGENNHFEIEFYSLYADNINLPVVRCQPEVINFNFLDGSSGKDSTHYLAPKLVDNIDLSKGKEFFDLSSQFRSHDEARLYDEGKGIKIKGTDPSINYSMQITHIDLTEKGNIIELYGFNGYTERDYYPDSAFSMERQRIKKLNIVTWSGILVEWPWASMLWYGEIIYFADQEEFGECCRLYFKEHGNDICPVCGNPLGNQLSFSFIDVTRKPHQFYFCSKDCLHKFDSNMMLYLKMLTTEMNLDYLLGIKM